MSKFDPKAKNHIDANGLEKFAVLHELRVNRRGMAPSLSVGIRGKSFPFI
jgi:hypothetical protein